MASDRTKRRNELAQKLGFANDYQRRKARETAQGKRRDYALEWERRRIRATGQGFRSVRQGTEFKASGKDRDTFLRDATLKAWGVTPWKFDQIRRENREWMKRYGKKRMSKYNRYDLNIDKDIHNFSSERVGYILSFNGAIVNGGVTNGKDNKEWYGLLTQYGGVDASDEYDDKYNAALTRINAGIAAGLSAYRDIRIPGIA